MASDSASYTAKFDVNVKSAVDNLKAVEAEAKRVQESLNGLTVGTAEYTKASQANATAQRNLVGAQRAVGQAYLTNSKIETDANNRSIATNRAKVQSVKDYTAELRAQQKAASTDKNPGVSQNIFALNPNTVSNTQKIAAEQNAIYNKYLEQQYAAQSKTTARIDRDHEAAFRADIKRTSDLATARIKAANTDANPGVSQKINSAANPNLGLNDKDLNSLSYSLFNVAQSVGVVGVALTGASAAAVGFGISYESAFSQVERTNPDLVTSEVTALKESLIDLSATIPVGFTQLSSIAALGSQLGIASDDLAQFSETTAQYATVTGISTDAAAQGFGSLFELLNVGAGDFEKLASSVNFVGVKSVATDQEILNLATSIGASTTQAGFLADQTIGLAGALASLRIQPEQARGVILRLFSDFDKAVSTGGTALTGYASILGTTTAATAKLYKSDPSEFFNQLLKGLSTTKDLNGALSALGITETREVNVIQRLAGNYDTYTASMQNANQAYTDGTFLGKSYATVAQTVAAQVQVLVNKIQNLLAKAGESVLPALAPVLKLVDIIVSGLNLVPAPVLAVITVITGLIGILALVVAGGLVFVATAGLAGNAMQQLAARGGTTGSVLVGLKSVVTQFTGALGINTAAARINAATIGSVGSSARTAALGVAGKSVAMRADTAATVGATAATTGFKAALLGVPIVNIIAGLSILVPLVLSFATAQSSAAAEAVKASKALAQAGGGVDGYLEALQADSEATDAFSKGQGKVSIAVSASAKEAAASADKHSKLVSTLNEVTGATDGATTSTSNLTGQLASQTLAVDKNAQAWVANALSKQAAGDENAPLAKVFNDADLKQKYEDTGFDISKAIADGLGKEGGVTGALQKQFDDYKKKMVDLVGYAGAGAFTGDSTYKELQKELLAAGSAADGLSGQLQGTQAIQAALGIDTKGTTDALASEGAAIADVGEKVGQLFDAASGAGDFTTKMNALQDAIDANGPSFDQFTAGGIANMDALGAALQAATSYGSQLGIPAADSMAQALASIGVDSSQIISLMQSLKASSPEIYASLNIDDVIAKYKQIAALGGTGGALEISASKAELGRLEAQRKTLQTQLASQRSSSSGGSSTPRTKTGKSDAEVAAENAKKIADSIKTASEYASDIGSAMKEAFDKKFGVSQAADDIADKFQAIKDRIKEAKQQVREFQATLQQLASDKQILNIQLKVAQDYGDAPRVGAIKADLATNKTDTASTTAQLRTAQDAASTSLVGNTKAARDNRAAVLDLVSAYQDQIQAFAATGASTQQIQAYTEQLRAKFIKQVTQLGYNRGAVKLYSDSFDTLRVAIGKVPTRKTVTLTVNNRDALAAVGAVGSKIGAISGQLSGLDKQIDAQKEKIAKQGRALAISAQIAQLQKQFDAQVGPEGDLSRAAVLTLARINGLKDKLASGNYASGGVIKGGARPASSRQDNTMINAQYGEGVVNLKGMALLGAAGLNAINKQQNPFPPVIINTSSSNANSSGTVVVELSAIDRNLLARAGNVQLAIDGRVISSTTNAVNLNDARRGRN